MTTFAFWYYVIKGYMLKLFPADIAPAVPDFDDRFAKPVLGNLTCYQLSFINVMIHRAPAGRTE
jgi:hypothetical protein